MRYRSRVACVYLLGFFVDLINMFIVNVAYPDVSRRLGASIGELAWVTNGYILGLTLVIPISGWLAGRFGFRRIFLLSILLFICGTALAAQAQSVFALIGWRVLQGVGGGLLIPIGQTMTYQLYRTDERAKLSAVIMLVGLLAPALSPSLGGIVVDNLSWRWIFIINLPLAGLTLFLAALWLRDTPRVQSTRGLDLLGLIMACLSLLLVLMGLTRLGEPQQHAQGLTALLAGGALMYCYVRRSLHQSYPLLNLRLLQQPVLRAAILVYQFIPGIFIGVSLVAMLYMQNRLAMSASQAGMLMLPWALASFVAISLTGKTFNRLGPRPLLLVGCLLQAIGIFLLTQLTASEQWAMQALAFALMGFGGSLSSSTAQSSAFIDIDNEQLADASALWNINRQLSFCLGTAALSLLLNVLLAQSGGLYQHAYRLCFYAATVISLVPLLFLFRLPNRAILEKIHLSQRSK
ncbi:MDR family MFS transporter [Rouxiella sp. Mn2063]|uniref:MDR family MFS transporter n=1 Tax=Rouxiella sp. Mn2063 TaxID=3395262 RepID=UPI003BDF66EF